MGYSIGNRVSQQLRRVELNEFGDFIMINPGDASFSHKFSELIKWLDTKNEELAKLSVEMGERYKDTPMIHTDEDGNVEVDTDQFSLYVKTKTDLYMECNDKVDALFGQDTLKKYFRAFYEINPEFMPDEECIMDFLEEIAPVLEAIYSERFDRINQKYNKNRKGGSKRK